MSDMLQLTDEQLDWICKQIPNPKRSAKGGRPPADKRKMVRGIFWILDNGAKWKDLPAEFGPKSTVHDWFHRRAESGVFERIMRKAGRCVEQRGGFRLYECFVDATFSKARQGGDGIGVTRVGKGVKFMLLVDSKGLPVAAYTTQAGPHESHAVQGLFDFMVTGETPVRLIGDTPGNPTGSTRTAANRGGALAASRAPRRHQAENVGWHSPVSRQNCAADLPLRAKQASNSAFSSADQRRRATTSAAEAGLARRSVLAGEYSGVIPPLYQPPSATSPRPS